MPNEYWKVTNKMSVLNKIRKTIVLDAFCVRAGIDNGSLFFSSRQAAALTFTVYTTVAQSLQDAFSVEFWYKTSANFTSTAGVVFSNARNISNGQNVKIGFLNGKVFCTVLRGAAESTVTSALNYTQGAWAHVCVTYDGTTVKIYQNTVVDVNTLTIAANLDGDGGHLYATVIGSAKDFTQLYIGAVSELRVWNRALLQTEILHNHNKRKGKNSGLLRYYRLNEAAAIIAITVNDTINSGVTAVVTNNANIYFQADASYPPLKLGASFIAGRYTITSSVKFSFKYPSIKPAGANFMLCVMWLNDAGVTQRYKLWDQTGVTMWPAAERYRGQTIPLTSYLEVWNQDGEEDCELESAYTLEVSAVTLPTTERDNTAIKLIANPTIDTTIGEPLSLTSFPLAFADNQFGTCAAPVAQTLANMSDNLTLYGAAQT